MARRVQTPASSTILPEKARAALGRFAKRALGITLFVLFAALLLSLISFNELDPDFNTSTTAPPENWLGIPGAYISDLLLQTLGLGSLALIFPLATWGWRIFSLKGIGSFWPRLGAFPISLTTWAAAGSVIPKGEAWPFESGYGGLLGERITELIASLYASIPNIFVPAYILAFLFWALLGLFPLLYSLGLEKAEWKAIARGVIRGLIYMFGLIGRLFRLLKPSDRKLKRPRREPFTNAPRSTSRDIRTPTHPRLGERQIRERQQAMNLGDPGKFKLPTLDLLSEGSSDTGKNKVDKTGLEQNARLLESVLDDFGIQGEILKVWPGPVVTLYELQPAPGTKSSKVVSLADDIARSMSAISARVATVPGRNVIGIELPNADRKTVYLREILATETFERGRGSLSLALGKDISGAPVVADLASMPHLLVAGTTGSGKSVGLNAMILSLLYKLGPHECKFIMVDPKMLELSVYEGIPHLLTPVVTEPKKAIIALKWAVKEMEERYRAMSKLGVRSLSVFNRRIEEAGKSNKTIKKRIQTGFDRETGEPVYEMQEFDLKPFPQIVIVIDEMADLMLVAGKDVEATVQRLSQMARAAGIHLIMATQRPSVDVITGTIKANFPTRIAFQVTSKIDSRTILGEQGAEQLLGAGDMLFMSGSGRIKRVHGPFVTDQEVEKVVSMLKSQSQPEYLADVTEEPDGGFDSPFIPGGNGGDELYQKAVEIVRRDRKASTSYIQRRLQIGYNRAATIMEQMEDQGIVSEPNHKGRREVLLPED